MPKLNVQQNNQNVIQAFKNALAIGNLKGIIASDGNNNFSTAGSNRNLLDNPWFTVNQRGAATVSSVGYYLDRWYSYNNYTVTANGITTTSAGSFDQTLESALKTALNGQTVTMSAKLADGTVYSATGTYYSAYGSTYAIGSGGGITFYITGDGKARYTFGNNLSIRAVKLELGSHSTLANDVPPDYSEELRKCKYYFERVKTAGNALSLGIGYNDGYNTMYGVMKIEPKRVTPSLSGSSLLIGTTSLNTTSSSKTIYSFGSDGTVVMQIVATNAFGTNQPYRFGLPSNGYIDFSADL